MGHHCRRGGGAYWHPSNEPPRALVVISVILCMHYWDILVLLVLFSYAVLGVAWNE